MAKFAFSLYGLPKYGKSDANQLYYNAGLTAWVYNYGSVYLAWDSINVDPNDPSPTHWALVRSYGGVPLNPNDAAVVAGGPIATYRVSIIDDGAGSVPNQEVYYSIWVYNGIEWVFCGSAMSHSVGSTDTLLRLSRRLPGAWLNDVNGIGDATGGPDAANGLVEFLSGLVLAYDTMRLKTELIYDISDYKKIPKGLLPAAVIGMGMPYEPTLGDYTHRSLYRVGHIINATKGTSRAVQLYTSALTHWGNKLSIGQNLMLDYNDSSFEESTGRWVVTGGTLARTAYAGSSVEAPVPPMSLSLFPSRKAGFATLTATAAGSVTMDLGGDNPQLYGVPVVENTTYTFSGYAKHATNGAGVTLTVTWYGATGNQLGTVSSTATSTSSWSDLQVTGVSPLGAHFAQAAVVVASTNANDEFHFDMFQFSESAAWPSFEDARVVKIQVDGDRMNYLPNPSFDIGMSGWNADNATITQDFSNSAARVFGSACAMVTATGPNPALISDWIPVRPGAPLTFSAYLTSSSARNVVARIEFTTPQSAANQTAILQDADGQYFPTTMEIVESAALQLTSTPGRVHVSAQSPALVDDNGPSMAKISLHFTDGVTDDVFYVDSCMLEQSPLLKPFFQGNGAMAPADPLTQPFLALNDCKWEWRKQTNLISNPTFDTKTGWTNNSGTSTSSVSTTGGLTPYAGNKMLKVSRANAGTATVTTTVYLENPVAEGGEDLALSIRVAGLIGDISIGDGSTSRTFTITADNSAYWTTLHLKRITAVGETSFTFTVSAPVEAGTTFYLNAPQVEAGTVSRAYVDTASSAVTSRPNASYPSATVYDSYAPQIGGGRSFYWNRYYSKYERLKNTLNLVLPMGATFQIISGEPAPAKPEETASLITSASFERSLAGWTGVSSTLAREVSRGSHFGEFAANGSSWCRVTATDASSFGLTADSVYVQEDAGYYLAVAVRPVDAIGTFAVHVDWLDENGGVLWTTSTSKTVTNTDRWAYIALTDKNIHNIGVNGNLLIARATKARVRIEATPSTLGAGKTFLVDRVLFRQ